MWPFKKEQQRMSWPLPEMDYEGNNLWRLRFPKQRTLTSAEMQMYKGMQGMNGADIQMRACNWYYENSILQQVIGPFGPTYLRRLY